MPATAHTSRQASHTQTTRQPSRTRTTRQTSRPARTLLPNPRRFLHCVACGTIKKERNYALCSECYKVNGTLDRTLFLCFARHTERESAAYSYRTHPDFAKACRVYDRQRQKARTLDAVDALVPAYRPPASDGRNRYENEPYDGLGPYDLGDLLDWQMHGAELQEPERSGHCELSDAEIARWDARVDGWVRAHAGSLDDEPAPDLQPWGYWMEIDGARVWTDDVD